MNDGPGDQTDPAISGDFVSYTSNADGTNRIRYHVLATSTDAVVPHSGQDDFLSDISGNNIVFTRVSATSSIFKYTIGAAAATEVAPSGDANRRDPAIGANTVAWQDFGFHASALQPEIVVHDLALNTTTRLTTDMLLDRTPAVSPDGNAVVWTKCTTSGTGCDIWKAVRVGAIWTTSAVTGSEGEEAGAPDSNGSVIAYASTRAGETDIFWQPLAGGVETRISLSGLQANPSVSGSLIAFDHRDASGTWDVLVFDMATSTLYRIPEPTSTTGNQTLNDIWVGSTTGCATVVYQSDATADSNVNAFSFCPIGPPGEGCPPNGDGDNDGLIDTQENLFLTVLDDSDSDSDDDGILDGNDDANGNGEDDEDEDDADPCPDEDGDGDGDDDEDEDDDDDDDDDD